MAAKKKTSALQIRTQGVTVSANVPKKSKSVPKKSSGPGDLPEAKNGAVANQTLKPKVTRRPNRIAGLDTLRALAVLLVIAYHFFPQTLAGGFIGVDIFFVISGFLITSLLLREYQVHGRVSLSGFWLRRARRLLPALGLMVLVCTAAAGIIGQDAGVGLPAQIFGAATFSSNWVYVVQGASYSASLTPALFANLWSLAVEEQFYLLWPLVVIAGMGFGAKKLGNRALVAATVSVVVGSAVAMAVMFDPEVDPSRLYYGTDTHLFGIMIGAVLAMVRRPNLAGQWPLLIKNAGAQGSGGNEARRKNTVVSLTVALLGLLIIVGAAVVLEFDAAITYRGGLLLVSVATATLIAAILSLQEIAPRLEKAPLRWIGQRSYGLYLWHWPVLILVTYLFSTRNVGTNVTMVTAAIALIVITAASWISYKHLELPIMSKGFRNYARRIKNVLQRSAAKAPRARLKLGLVLGASAVLTVLGVVAVIAVTTSPQTSSIEREIAAGEAALNNGFDWGQFADLGPNIAALAEAKQKAEDEAEAAAQRREVPVGDEVTVIGDSVTLASVTGLQEILPGVVIDAKTSRGIGEVTKIMSNLEAKGDLKEFVVISLATNGLVTDDDLSKIVKAAGEREIILVTAHAERSWIAATNKALYDAAQRYDNVVIADWNGVIADHPKELARDGIHPGQKGGERYAQEIMRALAESVAPR